ncbi:MAG: polysaccharide deacetylase family protein [Flavobacterium sp.]
MEEKCKIYAFYETPIEGVSVDAQLVKITREIYLTFDDGIQPGTEEVLTLLKEKGIKATFFLTGVHLWYAFSYYEEKAKKILKDIYENHIIGNHSYSHANDHYSSFYRDGGVKISDSNERLSVENDFEKNKNQINYYLEKIYGTKFSDSLPLAKNQKRALARFPGTNTWYVSEELKDIKKTDRGHTFELSKKDTAEEADILYKKGYEIFGWDVEWNMTFNFHDDAISMEKKQKTDYSKWEKTHPYFDMYSKENISKDRPKKSWENVRDEILDYAYDNPYSPMDNVSKTKGKVVLLMHERAFRKGKIVNGNIDLSNSVELDKLSNLIDYFKKIKAEFKTLEDY